MTEQQIKRIQEAVNISNTAIQCETEEEARMLFEAMGWAYEDSGYEWPTNATAPPNETVYYRDGNIRLRSAVRYEEEHKIIPFSTLLTPEPCGLVKGLWAAGAPAWLDVDVPFEFQGKQYVLAMDDGVVDVMFWEASDKPYQTLQLPEMFANPHEIHPVRVWGEETVEDAKAAMRLGFEKIKRSEFSGLAAIRASLTTGDCIPDSKFPELQPGECVALADIVEG